MPKCDQVLCRPFIIPKIVTTCHFSRQDSFQLQHKMDDNQKKLDKDCHTNKQKIITNGCLKAKLDQSDSLEDDNCFCNICSQRLRETNKPLSRSPSPFRKTSPFRRSPSPMAGYGYELYQKSLLEVPFIPEYGDASSDDLSSEWDSDVPDIPPRPVHPKVRYL